LLRIIARLVGGGNCGEAFLEIYYLERACQAQIAALSGGSKLVFPSEEVCRHSAAQFEPTEPYRMAHVKLAWASALRLLGDADYRS
jgi:ribulose-5-phosphate 4-epimerase/fuculose-1-phosphate aldolase